MSHIFIAHVEEDDDIALGIALGLEEAGYRTWTYELDSIIGTSYIVRTGEAVAQSDAVVVIISPHSLSSVQVTKEVVRAHESGKNFLPILRGISHVEFQQRQPEWREAIGSATSIRAPEEGAVALVPQVIEGVKALGIKPGPRVDASRVDRIRKALNETRPQPAVPEIKPPPADKTAKEIKEPKSKKPLVITLISVIALAIIVAAILLTRGGNNKGPGLGLTANLTSTPVASSTSTPSVTSPTISPATTKAASTSTPTQTSTPSTTSTSTPTKRPISTVPGTLKVNGSPGGVNVYVDDEFSGTTDVNWGDATVSGVSPGTHTLKLTKPGYKDWSKKVKIDTSQTTTIYAYLETGTGTSTTRGETISTSATFGTLKVNGSPGGVNVYVDDEFSGTTDVNWGDVTVSGLLPGTYTLKLTKAGYKDWSKKVKIDTTQTTTIYAYLESGTGASTVRSETISANVAFGTLKVNGSPGGVSVYVANEFGGTTDVNWGDATVSGLLPGTYTLKLTKPGYKDWSKKVEIDTSQTTTIYAYLETGTGVSTVRSETISATASFGTLKVNGSPGGVSVYVDSEYGGTTDVNWGDATVSGLLPGTYTLKLTKPGDKDWSKKVSIATSQTTTIYAYLETGTGTSTMRSETISANVAFGTLKVNGNPGGVNVYINSEFGGTTDVNWGDATVSGLLPGTYTLKLTKPGYKDWSKQVTIAASQTTTIYAYLEIGTGASTVRSETISASAAFGTLKVTSSPGGANVYIDGEFGGTTDVNWGDATVSGLLPGTYTLKLTKPGYKDWSKQVTVDSGQTATANAYLESSTSASLKSDTIAACAAPGAHIEPYTLILAGGPVENRISRRL